LWPHFYENSEIIDIKKQAQHNNFVKQIKALIENLKDEYELEFLTFHFSDTLLYRELGVEYNKKARLDTFIKQVSSLDLLVSMRYHGQITGFLTETPVVSISVQQKMDALMTNYQFDHYNNSIYNFSETKVLEDINEIFSNKEKVINEIILKNKFVGDKIIKVYSALDFNS
jgi:polysaccharide pyruvyl transferase WcaK-like protein